jgi:integrase
MMHGCRRIDGFELKRMLRASDKRLRALLLIGCTTGLRISEILQLTTAHILKEGRVQRRVFLDRKIMKQQRRGRVVFLAPETVKAVSAWLKKKRRSKWLFPGSSGNHMSRMHAHRMVKRAAINSGVNPKDVGTHSMRKKFAHDAYHRLDKNLSLLQLMMGHADIRSTQKYLEEAQDENLWQRVHRQKCS